MRARSVTSRRPWRGRERRRRDAGQRRRANVSRAVTSTARTLCTTFRRLGLRRRGIQDEEDRGVLIGLGEAELEEVAERQALHERLLGRLVDRVRGRDERRQGGAQRARELA